MSFSLYELAVNPEMQKIVQKEVDSAFAASKGEINEEVVNKLEYLEQCLMETVRMHSVVHHLSKISLKEYEFPPQYENATNTLKIEAGLNVVIPVNAFHL